ncbi:MAG TPA: hypothetical protein VFV41_02095 [Streptosporangiaceae bacterium]|nr:hypothetical protein [Streptosporangiaceae bacterium]
MDLVSRLQIKPGTLVSVVAAPADGPDLDGDGALQIAASPAEADAVIAFVAQRADLAAAQPAIEAAREDRLAWICYPKAGQLGTDLNRDSLAKAVIDMGGVRPVRQIAVNDVWSALRFRPA